MTESDRTQVLEGLLPTSTFTERIHAIREAGISVATIANITGDSTRTIQRWASGDVIALRNEDKARKVDDLRCVLGTLMLRGLEPEEAVQWLHSRRPDPPHERPINLVGVHTEQLLELIEQDLPQAH